MKTLHKSLPVASTQAVYHLGHPTGTKSLKEGGTVGDVMQEGKESRELWTHINEKIGVIIDKGGNKAEDNVE